MAALETIDDADAHDARVASRSVYIAIGPTPTMSDYWTHKIVWSDGWDQLFRSHEEAEAFCADYAKPR